MISYLHLISVILAITHEIAKIFNSLSLKIWKVRKIAIHKFTGSHKWWNLKSLLCPIHLITTHHLWKSRTLIHIQVAAFGRTSFSNTKAGRTENMGLFLWFPGLYCRNVGWCWPLATAFSSLVWHFPFFCRSFSSTTVTLLYILQLLTKK